MDSNHIEDAIHEVLEQVVSLPPQHAELVLRRALMTVEMAKKEYEKALVGV